jgi:hypothetical protein
VSDDRDLAEAIYAEIISLKSAERALDLWQHRLIGPNDLADMWNVLATISEDAIGQVLARRQREAARTGPWGDATPAADMQREATRSWLAGRRGQARRAGPSEEDGP